MSHFAVKRILTLLLALLFTVSAVSCALAEGNDASPASAQPENKEYLEPLMDFLKSLLPNRKPAEVRPKPNHEETVTALRELGIEIPDAMVAEIEDSMDYEKQMFAEWGYDYPEMDYEFPLQLLYTVGAGEYDYDTWTWMPSSSDIYAFDTEIFDISSMYTNFLAGISAIVPGFEPVEIVEEIHEDDRERDWTDLFDASEGTTAVSFTLNGKRYERELDYYGDWFNAEAIDWVNEIFEELGFEGRIYYLRDGFQGLILYYGDDELDRKIREITHSPLNGYIGMDF